MLFGKFFRHNRLNDISAFFSHKLNALFGNTSGNNRQIIFLYNIIIRSNCTLNNVFTEAPSTLDHNTIIGTGSQIYRKHDTCSLCIRHHLNGSRQSYILMSKTLLFSIINGTIRKSGSITFLNLTNNHILTLYIKISILLTGKRSIRQIFSSCGRSYSHIRIAHTHTLCKFIISITDSICQITRHFRRNDTLTNFQTNILQLLRIFNITQSSEQFMNFFILSGFFHKITIGISRCRISVRHRNLRCGSKFTQRRRLTADNTHIGSTQLLKP